MRRVVSLMDTHLPEPRRPFRGLVVFRIHTMIGS